MNTWDELKYWQSGEWQVIQEKLDDLDKAGTLYNPPRHLLFAAMDACPLDTVKVAIIGQDPYPDRNLCTGLAFSIPPNARIMPPTLNIMLEEYSNDLHYPKPTSGDLSRWCKQGVFLWNSIPSCLTGDSLSHDYQEWRNLTEEIIRELASKRVVIVTVGNIAREQARVSDEIQSTEVLAVCHPAAERYGRSLKNRFSGSRIFTTINDKLCGLGQQPINWRLT